MEFEKKEGTELLKKREIEGTPFVAVEDNTEEGKTKWYGVTGIYKVTPNCDSEEEVKELIEKKDWNVIGALMWIYIHEWAKKEKEESWK